MDVDADGGTDTISVWMKHKDVEVEPLKVILWRIKNIRRMGEDAIGHFDGPGGQYPMKWKDALQQFQPTILEILFTDNPFHSLLDALTQAQGNFFRDFFCQVRYLHVSNSDVRISDLTISIPQMPSLVAFSYSKREGISNEEFEQLISVLSVAKIRAVDINGSCEGIEIDRIVRNLDVEMVRFCASPGASVDSFVNTTATSPTVEFVVAQSLDFSAEDDGLKFLKKLKTVFPCMKSLYWDWNMIDPHVDFNDQTRTCIELLANLYRELDMRALAVVFYVPTSVTQAAVEPIWEYFKSFSLPNTSVRKLRTKGVLDANCEPNFTLFLAGTSDKLERLEKIIYDNRITSPDLRHFLYVLDPLFKIFTVNATFEFMGFNVQLADA